MGRLESSFPKSSVTAEKVTFFLRQCNQIRKFDCLILLIMLGLIRNNVFFQRTASSKPKDIGKKMTRCREQVSTKYLDIISAPNNSFVKRSKLTSFSSGMASAEKSQWKNFIALRFPSSKIKVIKSNNLRTIANLVSYIFFCYSKKIQLFNSF